VVTVPEGCPETGLDDGPDPAVVVPTVVAGGRTLPDEAAALVTVRATGPGGGAIGCPWSLTHIAALPRYQACGQVNPGKPAFRNDFPQLDSTATHKDSASVNRNP